MGMYVRLFENKEHTIQYTYSVYRDVVSYYQRYRKIDAYTPWEPISKWKFYKKIKKIISEV